jgi:hypothetical protein
MKPLRLLILPLACALLCAPHAAAARPNILYIMADDHAAHAIGAYGSKVNKTPNIDRIAAEGMRFTQCLVTNSICTPAAYSHPRRIPVLPIAFRGRRYSGEVSCPPDFTPEARGTSLQQANSSEGQHHIVGRTRRLSRPKLRDGIQFFRCGIPHSDEALGGGRPGVDLVDDLGNFALSHFRSSSLAANPPSSPSLPETRSRAQLRPSARSTAKQREEGRLD